MACTSTHARERYGQHLFISENTPLNPHRLADNERFLRDKDFILDSRIVVTPVEGSDSVDLTVITRDVFSLGGTMEEVSPRRPRWEFMMLT